MGSASLLGLLLEPLHFYLFGLPHLLELLLVHLAKTDIKVHVFEVIGTHRFQVVLLAELFFLTRLLALHKNNNHR
jgi:hypothetical protein